MNECMYVYFYPCMLVYFENKTGYREYVCMYACMHACIYVCMYVCVCVRVCACVCASAQILV
jgi:hypothetical protein